MGLLIVFGPSWRGGCVAGSSPNDGSLGVCLKNSIICMQMQHKFTEGIWLDESSVRSLTYICWCLKPFERQKPMALGVALLQKGQQVASPVATISMPLSARKKTNHTSATHFVVVPPSMLGVFSAEVTKCLPPLTCRLEGDCSFERVDGSILQTL